MMADEHVQQPPSDRQKAKKPFEPPRLQVYGDISALTRKVGRTGAPDGGASPTNKTKV